MNKVSRLQKKSFSSKVMAREYTCSDPIGPASRGFGGCGGGCSWGGGRFVSTGFGACPTAISLILESVTMKETPSLVIYIALLSTLSPLVPIMGATFEWLIPLT